MSLPPLLLVNDDALLSEAPSKLEVGPLLMPEERPEFPLPLPYEVYSYLVVLVLLTGLVRTPPVAEIPAPEVVPLTERVPDKNILDPWFAGTKLAIALPPALPGCRDRRTLPSGAWTKYCELLPPIMGIPLRPEEPKSPMDGELGTYEVKPKAPR